MVSGCKSTCYMNWSLLPFRLDKLVGISSRKNFFWTFPDILWRLGALFRTRQEVSLSNSNKTCHFLSYAHLRKYSMERKSQNDNVENYRKKNCFALCDWKERVWNFVTTTHLWPEPQSSMARRWRFSGPRSSPWTVGLRWGSAYPRCSPRPSRWTRSPCTCQRHLRSPEQSQIWEWKVVGPMWYDHRAIIN